jgi:hypothetical protein
MKHLLPGLVAFLLVSLPEPALAAPPERTVAGNRLISKKEPALQIKLPRNVLHLGADRFVLNDLADCELHVFVEADRQKNVKVLYWIQFEGFLPTNSHRYSYSKDELVTFDGLPFRQIAGFGPANKPTQAGSDLEHMRQIVERAGYHLPAEYMHVRLVHLLDDTKRKELMFIYAEDLASTGKGKEQLMDGDQPRPEWAAIQRGLIERAMKRIELIQPRP